MIEPIKARDVKDIVSQSMFSQRNRKGRLFGVGTLMELPVP